MKTASRFDNRVKNYVKYRPHYPAEILALFRNEMNLKEDSVVADIGSGTGISAKLFLENGNRVFGVEPNELMRRASEEYLADFPNFQTVDGTAENTGLPDQSIDLIVAAQAFHWFKNEETLQEFRRIGRENAILALIWNERQLDSNKFLREYERFLIEFGTDYGQVRHDQINKETLEDFFKTEFSLKTFQNSQTFDFEGLKGRLLSSSYMPSEDHPRFSEMKKNLKRLFAEHAEQDKIQVLYDTNVFYTPI